MDGKTDEIGGSMDGWIDGWIDGSMDQWIDGSIGNYEMWTWIPN